MLKHSVLCGTQLAGSLFLQFWEESVQSQRQLSCHCLQLARGMRNVNPVESTHNAYIWHRQTLLITTGIKGKEQFSGDEHSEWILSAPIEQQKQKEEHEWMKLKAALSLMDEVKE